MSARHGRLLWPILVAKGPTSGCHCDVGVAAVLEEARQAGEIPGHIEPEQMAKFFWIGWEGAVLRAKLEQSPQPLDQFAEGFMALVRSC